MTSLTPTEEGPGTADVAGQEAAAAERAQGSTGGAHAAAPGFARQAGLTVLGAVIPGAGLWLAGRRRTGGVALLGWLLAVGAGGYLVTTGRAGRFGSRLVVDPRALTTTAVVLAVVVTLWCLLIVLTAVSTRPDPATAGRRAGAALLVLALCLVVALPGAVGVRYALLQRGLLLSVFADAGSSPARAGSAAPGRSADPWRSTPRVNVLLVGGDAGEDRKGLRADSLLVASIDTHSGSTVLFSLPRNLENVPFPATDPLHRLFPHGYNCGGACLLNAIWETAKTHADLFPGDPNPGLTATRDAVGEVLGLHVDYYGLVDLKGFQSVVDALGGAVVNVPRRIPIGGGHNLQTGASLPISGYIEPGRQRLDGYHALWFARSREGSDDYDRMRRQRCLLGDLIDQANPLKLVRAFPGLAASARANIATDVPRQDLPAWVELARRVKAARVTSLPFTSQVINTGHPDFARIRTLVRQALRAQAAGPAAASPRPATSAPTLGPSIGPRPSGSPAPVTADDLAAIC